MALALTNCEAPNIVAASGQTPKGEPGANAAESMAEGFKKKLQDCVAMVIPMQQPTMDGSVVNSEDGMQTDLGMLVEASGQACILEGFEMPQHPTGDVETPTTAVEPNAMPMEGMVQENNAAEERQPDTTEPIARTQNTTAGDTPVKTQDEILKTIGAYIEPTDTEKQSAEGQPKGQALPNTTNASEGQENRTAGVPDMIQKPAMVQAEEEGVSADASPAKREVLPTELPEEAVKPQSASMMTADMPETPLTVSDTAVADTEAHVEEAQYTRENVMRIVDKVSTSAAEGRYDFDVELKPDFLGKVSIKLTMQNGTIRMQIKAEDISVRSMLADQTTALQSALKDKGVTLTSVDVAYQSQASLDNGGQPSEQHNGNGRQNGTYYAQADTTAFEAATETYNYYVGNSSVEFLA